MWDEYGKKRKAGCGQTHKYRETRKDKCCGEDIGRWCFVPEMQINPEA